MRTCDGVLRFEKLDAMLWHVASWGDRCPHAPNLGPGSFVSTIIRCELRAGFAKLERRHLAGGLRNHFLRLQHLMRNGDANAELVGDPLTRHALSGEFQNQHTLGAGRWRSAICLGDEHGTG